MTVYAENSNESTKRTNKFQDYNNVIGYVGNIQKSMNNWNLKFKTMPFTLTSKRYIYV